MKRPWGGDRGSDTKSEEAVGLHALLCGGPFLGDNMFRHHVPGPPDRTVLGKVPTEHSGLGGCWEAR